MRTREKLTLAMLIGLVAISGGAFSTSLAWYASNALVQLDNINISVCGDKNLRISKQIDGEYLERIDDYQLPVFEPVSSMNQDQWLGIEGKLPSFYAYHPGLTTPYKAEHGFFSEVVYFQCDHDVYVSLDPSKCFINPDEAYNADLAKKKIAEGGNYVNIGGTPTALSQEEVTRRLNDTKLAMRVSVYDIESGQFKIYDPYKDEDTYLGGLLDNDRDGYYDYDTFTYKEIVYGEYEGHPEYGSPLNDDSKWPGEYNSFNAKHKSGVLPFDDGSVQFQKEVTTDFEELTYDEIYDGTDKLCIYMEADTPHPVVLSFYLEGWDKDCVNSIMGAGFHAQIQFQIYDALIKAGGNS